MMQVSINVSGTDQVRAMLARIGPVLTGKALAQTAEDVENYIEREAGRHEKTGALNRSIFKRRESDGSWIVGHDRQHAPHAVFVLFGTRAHVIKPKNKKALRWAGGGAFRFAKKVHHPGNAPDNWLQRAAALAPQIFEQHVAAQMRRATQG